MPLLQVDYTDKSGTRHPAAVFEVVAVHVDMALDRAAADYQIVGYHDVDARASGLDPFERRPFVPLTPTQLTQIQTEFAGAFYALLLTNPEFAHGSIIDVP